MAKIDSNPWTSTEQNKRLFKTYLGQFKFLHMMGEGPKNIIQRKSNVKKKTLEYDLLGEPTGTGVSGASGVLTGNESQFDKYRVDVTPDTQREGHVIVDEENSRSDRDLFNEFGPQLREWARIKTRSDTIDAMMSIAEHKMFLNPLNPLINAGAANQSGMSVKASDGEINAWMVRQSDERVVFGTSDVAPATGDFAASLAAITAGELMGADLIEALKDKAFGSQTEKMTPTGLDGEGNEYGYLLLGPKGYRQTGKDDRITKSIFNNYPRDKRSPIIKGSSREHDGVIIDRCYEFPTLVGAGAASVDLEPFVFFGAQALAFAERRSPKYTIGKEDDYEHLKKRGIKMSNSLVALQRKKAGETYGRNNGMIIGFIPAV